MYATKTQITTREQCVGVRHTRFICGSVEDQYKLLMYGALGVKYIIPLRRAAPE